MEYTCNLKINGINSIWTATISPMSKNRAFYEVEINGRGSSFHVICGPQSNGHFLCIPNWQVGCELGEYNDVFWNSEQLGKQLSPVDTVTVALGLPHLLDAFKKQHPLL